MSKKTKVTHRNLTDKMLREEFRLVACKCRPLDLRKTSGHEGGCDISMIHDIQTALFASSREEAGSAKFRIAEAINLRNT